MKILAVLVVLASVAAFAHPVKPVKKGVKSMCAGKVCCKNHGAKDGKSLASAKGHTVNGHAVKGHVVKGAVTHHVHGQ